MSDTDSKSSSSRETILEAALEVFAEKGFDGARVDEIAKRAKVNKALIYYYFESKDKILEELMEQPIKEGINLKRTVFDGQSIDDFISMFQSDKFNRIFSPMLDYMKKQKSIMSIIISEALKEDGKKENLFKMVDRFIEDGVARLKQGNIEIKDYESFMITAVFFAFIPAMNFIMFGEKWAEHSNMDYQIAEEKFVNVIQSLYADYYLKEVVKKKE